MKIFVKPLENTSEGTSNDSPNINKNIENKKRSNIVIVEVSFFPLCSAYYNFQFVMQ